MNEELRAELARMEGEISSLASDCDLALQDANAVRSYLAHNELGVALEYLCDTLIETEAEITEGQCRRILDAAKALGMLAREPTEWSQRMETLLGRVTFRARPS
jgi:hypothetical protein